VTWIEVPATANSGQILQAGKIRSLELRDLAGDRSAVKFVVSKVREERDLRETLGTSEIQVDTDFLFMVPTPPD
jgi:hypothetical protein